MRGAGTRTGGEIKGGAMKKEKRYALRRVEHHEEITAIKETLLNQEISGAVASRPGPCKRTWTLSEKSCAYYPIPYYL